MKKLILLALMALATASTSFQAAPARSSTRQAEIPPTHLTVLLSEAAPLFEMNVDVLKAEYENGEVGIKLIDGPYVYEVKRMATGGIAILDVEDLL